MDGFAGSLEGGEKEDHLDDLAREGLACGGQCLPKISDTHCYAQPLTWNLLVRWERLFHPLPDWENLKEFHQQMKHEIRIDSHGLLLWASMSRFGDVFHQFLITL